VSERVELSDDRRRGYEDSYLRKMADLTHKLGTVTMPCSCGRRASVASTQTGRLRLFCADCASAARLDGQIRRQRETYAAGRRGRR
jgi:hypothetical protein